MGIIVCGQIVAVTVRSPDMRPVKDVSLLRLGEAIRAFRSKRGWTQEEFAYQCGLDRSYVGGIMSNEPIELGKRLIEYCEKFSIPLEYVFAILDDQKVVPMIRGKATEYSGYMAVTHNLSQGEWAVQKLNLNARTGS